jgi:hypothetical protein
MKSKAIDTWHRILDLRKPEMLKDLLADNVVFHSPVVHTPQVGKEITLKYLTAAFYVLYNDSFQYVREVINDNHAALEFTVEIDGIHVNGIDLITWNDDDKIIDFKVMIRPLQAVNLIHQKMSNKF